MPAWPNLADFESNVGQILANMFRARIFCGNFGMGGRAGQNPGFLGPAASGGFFREKRNPQILDMPAWPNFVDFLLILGQKFAKMFRGHIFRGKPGQGPDLRASMRETPRFFLGFNH